jgi:hypothetical protein
MSPAGVSDVAQFGFDLDTPDNEARIFDDSNGDLTERHFLDGHQITLGKDESQALLARVFTKLLLSIFL